MARPVDGSNPNYKSENFKVLEMRGAAEAMERRDFAQLRALGVTRLVAGIGRVREVGEGLYEPEDSPFGHWRWITPVCIQHPDTPESDDPDSPMCGPLVDLVAWHEAAPEAWLLRTGLAGWLGRIELQHLEPAPVRIWRSPLSWMRHGCVGMVPLSRDRRDLYFLLSRCVGGLIAENSWHAADLRQVLDYPRSQPPVYVGV
jgi:hypothetical protein